MEIHKEKDKVVYKDEVIQNLICESIQPLTLLNLKHRCQS